MTELDQRVGAVLESTESLTSVEAEGLEEVTYTNRQLAWCRYRRRCIEFVALVVFVIIAVATFLAPWIAPYDYRAQDTSNTFSSPSSDHWFGTDSLGRDVFSRVLYGGRVSIFVGLATAVIAGILGVLVGTVAGYFRGRTDAVLLWFTDVMLALPFVIVAIMAVRILGSSVRNIVLILALTAWMPLAKIVRGLVLGLKEREYVESAIAMGAKNSRIIRKHLLPNMIGPIVVNLTIVVAVAILGEATLSFLGAGIVEPTPSWGNMVFKEKGSTLSFPHLIIFPGLAIVITVLCVNFIGDGLRDALDPTQRKTG
ncbi:MAG: ABC transporter permease [Acidimicrobiales bacterium]